MTDCYCVTLTMPVAVRPLQDPLKENAWLPCVDWIGMEPVLKLPMLSACAVATVEPLLMTVTGSSAQKPWPMKSTDVPRRTDELFAVTYAPEAEVEPVLVPLLPEPLPPLFDPPAPTEAMKAWNWSHRFESWLRSELTSASRLAILSVRAWSLFAVLVPVSVLVAFPEFVTATITKARSRDETVSPEALLDDTE